MTIRNMTVDLGDRRYPILIGSGAWEHAALSLGVQGRACVVTDDLVSSIYLEKLQSILLLNGIDLLPPVVFHHGEGAKNWNNLEHVIDHLLAHGVDRKTTVIALGGGVVGDLAGFAAAVTLRGLPFIQVPTTLLSQVDSSVGGKTGINAAHGKNLVGSFYQPQSVWIDTDCLLTLPLREFKAGYAEVLKYSLINAPEFFTWLDAHAEKILLQDTAVLDEIIARSCLAKAEIVTQDEREETGIRALLNLGHTFGHALESLAGFDGRLLHGEAVSIGMLMAASFSERFGYAPSGTARTLRDHMSKMGLMLDPPMAVTAGDMVALMRRDKKSMQGKIQLVLMRGIGNSFLASDIDGAQLHDFLEFYLAERPS